MPADTRLTRSNVHATGLVCTQVTADTSFRFATGTQPVSAGVCRWHTDFPVPCFYAYAYYDSMLYALRFLMLYLCSV
ncbi:uncharacterized protein LACBIDRAFT_307201 [Laccaria bicolor S238N-H82]|uniref:Predicted protein n=1 Tax=Laccaria bicolor (strain S238N-H82 / ATCC MYA-4686) TaxID=486041 RepID=B0DPM2_LACBS|nr:uncharacterized protein LACBIDRAFT_307201 [Laccaria bicolor S238N-H82]EDR03400.1 predicted protein [Laccaria bicolor S238N-H82]|eukprot:XP_001885856.1 predicted protein [Laccaria bicolor S238N-H82]